MKPNSKQKSTAYFTVSIIAAFLTVACLRAGAETIPLPRERPAAVPGDQLETPSTNVGPSPCQLRLAALAEFKPAQPITGPGECSATDVVTLEAVLLFDRQRVVFSPAAILRCTMAEAVAQWVRNDVAPAIAEHIAPLRGVETLDSFSCRTFNGVSGARMSEHGHANALDVHSFKLANSAIIELTNAERQQIVAREDKKCCMLKVFDCTRQRGRCLS